MEKFWKLIFWNNSGKLIIPDLIFWNYSGSTSTRLPNLAARWRRL
jgi:hypothetical protein